MKAKAWLDLTARAAAGAQVDSKTIRKHRNYVFRLFQVIDADTQPNSPFQIVQDMRTFLERMADESVDLKSLGLGACNFPDVLDQLRRIYAA